MEALMKLPSNEQLSKMSMEQLLGLWRLVREFRIKLANAEGVGCMPASAVKAMTDVLDDRLMSDIVNDSRRGVPAPSGLAGPVEPRPLVERGSGWQKPTPLEPPSGVRYVDEIARSFAALDKEQMIAEAIDRVRKIKG
jgi:hypothetical protein